MPHDLREIEAIWVYKLLIAILNGRTTDGVLVVLWMR